MYINDYPVVDITLIEMLDEEDAKSVLNSAETNDIQRSNSTFKANFPFFCTNPRPQM